MFSLVIRPSLVSQWNPRICHLFNNEEVQDLKGSKISGKPLLKCLDPESKNDYFKENRIQRITFYLHTKKQKVSQEYYF